MIPFDLVLKKDSSIRPTYKEKQSFDSNCPALSANVNLLLYFI